MHDTKESLSQIKAKATLIEERNAYLTEEKQLLETKGAQKTLEYQQAIETHTSSIAEIDRLSSKNEVLEQRITHFDTVLMEKLKYIAEIEWHLQQVNIDNEQS